jgi:hypothetical protein
VYALGVATIKGKKEKEEGRSELEIKEPRTRVGSIKDYNCS